MDIDKLLAELTDDPEVIGYASMDADAAAAAMNDPTRTYMVTLGSRQVLEWAMQDERLAGVIDAAATGSKAIRAIAIGARALIERPDTEIDLNKPIHNELIQTLETASALNVGSLASLQALATRTRSRGEELGLGVVRVEHVNKARR